MILSFFFHKLRMLLCFSLLLLITSTKGTPSTSKSYCEFGVYMSKLGAKGWEYGSRLGDTRGDTGTYVCVARVRRAQMEKGASHVHTYQVTHTHTQLVSLLSAATNRV